MTKMLKNSILLLSVSTVLSSIVGGILQLDPLVSTRRRRSAGTSGTSGGTISEFTSEDLRVFPSSYI